VCAGATEGLAKGEWLAAVRGCSFEAWRNSPGHNAVMITAGFVVIGVGKAHSPQSATTIRRLLRYPKRC